MKFKNAFPTYVGVSHWNNVKRYNENIASYLTRNFKPDYPKTIESSNFISKPDRVEHVEKYAEFSDLFKWIISESNIYLKNSFDIQESFTLKVDNAWANIYSKGASQPSHIHSNVAFVAVYCVSSPKNRNSNGGEILFHDPRHGSTYFVPKVKTFGNQYISYRLVQGELLIFPGWLAHSVSPYFEIEERITISVNLNFL